MDSTRRPRFAGRRWQALAVLVSGVCLIALMYHAYATVYTTPDLQVWWLAARLWLSGVDPYGATGDRLLGTGSGFAYPFPAVLICLPLALLPLAGASTVWALMSLSVAFALPFAFRDTPEPRFAGMMLAYFPLWASMEEGQWGPLLLLWTLLSLRWLHRSRWLLSGSVASLTLLKPHVGIALLAGLLAYAWRLNVPARWWLGLAGGLFIFWGGTQMLAPGWVLAWIEQIRAYDAEDQNRIDALSMVGMLSAVLATIVAALAWRRRDAPLLLAAVVVVLLIVLPTRSFYNHAVLLLPLTVLTMRAPRLAALTIAASWGVLALPFISADADIVLARSLGFYLPLVSGLAGIGRHIPENRNAPCAS